MTLSGFAYPEKTERSFYGFLATGSRGRSYVITSERALYGMREVVARWIPQGRRRMKSFVVTGIVASGNGTDFAILAIDHDPALLPAPLPKKLGYPNDVRPERMTLLTPGQRIEATLIHDRSAQSMGEVSVFEATSLPAGAPAIDDAGELLGIVSARPIGKPSSFGILTGIDAIRPVLHGLAKAPKNPKPILQWSRWNAGTWFGLWYASASKSQDWVRAYFLENALEKAPGAYAAEYDLARVSLARSDLTPKDLEAIFARLTHVESYVPADPWVYLDQVEVLVRLGKLEDANRKFSWVQTYHPECISDAYREKIASLASH